MVIAAYLAGVPAATSQIRVLFVQAAVVAAMMWLLRRGGRRADAIVADRDLDRRQAMVAAARRADERHHRMQMHDSVLATLAMVASGAVRADSPGQGRSRGADQRRPVPRGPARRHSRRLTRPADPAGLSPLIAYRGRYRVAGK
ncbi:hypothetical protein GCM10010191_11630 [Actinomadura vinacea]|uniref:Signal transduction histidine kinase subgroup 3 dimerisation and phosphoacceptor domain-containing protein n=1 Tax=Actinomadura vinacea TaxID=115336 RepID=A0ABN3IJU2_9ACTN